MPRNTTRIEIKIDNEFMNWSSIASSSRLDVIVFTSLVVAVSIGCHYRVCLLVRLESLPF